MSNVLTITSTSNGLSADRLLLGPGKWQVFVSAPDWDGSKTAQIYSAPVNSDASYSAERWGYDGSDGPVELTANQRLLLYGSCFVALHLANAGTGATLTFKKFDE